MFSKIKSVLLQSKGLKRTLAIGLMLLPSAVPALAPYQGQILEAAQILGTLGLSHAAFAKLLELSGLVRKQ